MANKMIQLCKANFPLSSGIDTKGTTGLWLSSFQQTPDDVFETVIRLTLLSCKSFPTVAEIRRAIDELRQEVNTQPKPRAISRSKKAEPKILLEMAQAKNGMAKEVVANIDISELMAFARYKLPYIPSRRSGLTSTNCLPVSAWAAMLDEWLLY